MKTFLFSVFRRAAKSVSLALVSSDSLELSVGKWAEASFSTTP